MPFMLRGLNIFPIFSLALCERHIYFCHINLLNYNYIFSVRQEVHFFKFFFCIDLDSLGHKNLFISSLINIFHLFKECVNLIQQVPLHSL